MKGVFMCAFLLASLFTCAVSKGEEIECLRHPLLSAYSSYFNRVIHFCQTPVPLIRRLLTVGQDLVLGCYTCVCTVDGVHCCRDRPQPCGGGTVEMRPRQRQAHSSLPAVVPQM
ncbi:uncharacterized protein LOC101851177 [Aplysia californica]|uniref:Uncharacterized protein LOC101851177 n=1 Tax=Aplysia californica TaxID=6500 RepID=A0ABM0JGD9_APLCA|nr:uncharacterized protein LOC101851177 [Aplysia californica]